MKCQDYKIVFTDIFNNMKITILFLSIIILNIFPIACTRQPQYDICIYGGTSAGVIAAYSAKKPGNSVVLIVPVCYPHRTSHMGQSAWNLCLWY